MKKTLIATLVATSVVAFTGVACAADTSGFSGQGSGGYVGVNVGYASVGWNPSDFANPNVISVSDKTGVTYGLDLGYMFNRNLGLEFGYDFYPTQKTHSAVKQDSEVKDQSFPSLSTVFNFPIAMQWDVFAKLGLAYLSPKVEDNNSAYNLSPKVWAPQIAVGGAYDIMPNLSLDAQLKYIAQTKDTSATITPSYSAFTVGVNYKF